MISLIRQRWNVSFKGVQIFHAISAIFVPGKGTFIMGSKYYVTGQDKSVTLI